jgi:hypothetical protein
MKPSTNELLFTVTDRIDDTEIGPRSIPLNLLGEFQKEVKDFLTGTTHDIDPKEVTVSIEDGSLAFVVSGFLVAASLLSDIEKLRTSHSLDHIDSKRANVVERWQNASAQNPNRRYFVANKTTQLGFSIDSNSNYSRSDEIWVNVEKYLDGIVIDLGGKKEANVHLDVQGKTLTIAANRNLLAEEEKNRLYRPSIIRVTAEENLVTGDLRNYRLLSFETNRPSYDDDEFGQMVERGTKAWSDVPDNWLEELRGGSV